MNDKTTLQELVELLVLRHQMVPADAEAFVKAVLGLIEEALERDKYVKIKGLGTFKLIEIEERASVDVNTGERIRIQGHSRISFLPDPALRDLINKPFSHFETVVLNENTHFDDLEENLADEKDEEEDERGEELDVASMDAIPEEADEPEKTPQGREASGQSNDCKNETVSVSIQPDILETESVQTDLTSKKMSRLPWCMIASVLLVGVLLGGGVIWGFLSGRRYIPEAFLVSMMEEKKMFPAKDKQTVDSLSSLKSISEKIEKQADSIQTITRRDTLRECVKQQAPSQKSLTVKETPKTSLKDKPESLSDTVEYTISGTKFIYTLEEGESLVKVALKFYGNKKLWPYLVKHNNDVIKDPNNVSAGLIIRIPILVPKK